MRGGRYSKIFGAGADFVMLGGMLAGHDECRGEKVGNHRGTKMKFYGMSSDDAQLEYYGEKKAHRASEGKTVMVDYRVCKRYRTRDSRRSEKCLYLCRAKTIKDLPKCTTFVRVNRQLNEIFS